MRRASRVAAVALLLCAGCTSDRVRLTYELPQGRQLSYRLTVVADVTRNLSGTEGEQRVRATFGTSQTVELALPGGGAQARISLEPRSLTVDGRRVDAGPGQEFTVGLTADGRVASIAAAGGAGAEELAPVGIERLLPRLRPVLPPQPVATGDRWSSTTRFDDTAGTFSLAVDNQLVGLSVTDGHRTAVISSAYTSPVDRTETFANATAEIDGRDVGNQRAWFALEGFVVRAVGDSAGTYRVTFRPPGAGPGSQSVRGSIDVRIHTELVLERSGQA